jgi:hypothetical protein
LESLIEPKVNNSLLPFSFMRIANRILIRKGVTMARKYSKKASEEVEKAVRKQKKGTLKSGRSGKKVTSRKQAVAIGLSEARKKGAKAPKKKE